MDEHHADVAGVRFRNAGKIFYFHAAGLRLETGEYVVVDSVRGPELARVVIAPDQVVINELGEELKPILRLATEDDIRRMDALKDRAEAQLIEARGIANDAGFPARIDTAEYTLDGRRLTLSFTSEERLDYRDVQRRTSDRFGVKVDLRQMGSRDRAKAAGGYGICGRELCCSNWLTTFPSISIRMAKEQELPLNPQKISGLCGRLLCCLSYEEAGYKEMRKTLPKMGQRCSTPTGEGKVISVNILKRQVTLWVEGQRIEVGDRDLGTVVRWDTASKIGTPPPSMTRAEAIEAGLIERDADDDIEQPEQGGAPEVDWITGRALVTETPGGGRGRLPGGGPRKTGSSRPRPGAVTPEAQPPAGGPPQRGRGGPPSPPAEQRQQPRGRGADPQRQGGRPQGAGQGPAMQPGQARTFRRAEPKPTQDDPAARDDAAPSQPGTPPEPRPEGAGRRRRRGRGGRPDAPGPATPSE